MTDTARDQALAQVASIVEMIGALDVDYDRLDELRESAEDNRAAIAAYAEKMDDWQAYSDATSALDELAELEAAAGDCTSEDEALERIDEDPLSVEVRSGWNPIGDDMTPEEFRITLCTGGPHVEIQGDIGQHGQPCSVRVLFRDWGESGELFDFDHSTVERYCAFFIGL